MRMRQLIGGVLFSVAGLGCTDPAGPDLSDQSSLVLQVVPELNWRTLPDDQVTITTARLEGRTLYLTLRFGGGCRTHGFALVAGTELGESNPPYTLFRLAHDGNGDMCEALLLRNVEVDLTPIVLLVQQSGGTALRFSLVEPGDQVSDIGELLLTF